MPRPHSNRSPLAAVLASLLVLSVPVQGQEISNPGLFTKSAAAAWEALETYGVYVDHDETERLQRIGYAIAEASGFEDYPFSFYLVDMAIPNAFALPAGHIFITRGMIDLGLDDDMLAGLLGHEIAHVTQQHFLKMQRRANLMTIASQVLTLGALIGAAQSDGNNATIYDPLGYRASSSTGAELAQGIAMGSMVLTELLLRSYGREYEDESDEEGQRFAAAAGFDPDGTRRLMEKMESRLPQDQTFGYWQTHPFFAERVRAARARKTTFHIEDASDSSAYRQTTQKTLLAYLETQEPASGAREDAQKRLAELIKDTALTAWPRGEIAEGLRLEKLRKKRQEVESAPQVERDYGELLAAYAEHRQIVVELTPASDFLPTVDRDVAAIRDELGSLYPGASKVLDGEVQQTEFLATFLSNYPDSDRAPEVALKLGESYARLSRETDAVDRFLQAWRADPEGPRGASAKRGLRALAPVLTRLAALERLATQDDDPELRDLAAARLDGTVLSYEDLENGAELLERFPESRHTAAVLKRQDRLADKLYREVFVYQKVGDHAKAVAGINRILKWAPYSAAAKLLGEGAVVSG